MNEALLIIDMQKYFYNQKPEIFDEKIIPNLKAQLSKFRESKKKIVHIRTVYLKDKSNWPNIRKADQTIWCVEGSGTEDYIPGFVPLKEETEIVKTRYSSFYKTNLKQVFEEAHIDRIVLAGFSSDVCIRATAFDAYNEGFEIILLKDCMHSIREDFDDSIQYFEWVLKAKSV